MLLHVLVYSGLRSELPFRGRPSPCFNSIATSTHISLTAFSQRSLRRVLACTNGPTTAETITAVANAESAVIERGRQIYLSRGHGSRYRQLCAATPRRPPAARRICRTRSRVYPVTATMSR